MSKTQAAARNTATDMGAAMMISWVLVLGPVGFLLLLGLTYFMVTQHHFAACVCGALLFSPVVLTAVWFPLAWYALFGTQKSEERRTLRNAQLSSPRQ